MRFVSNRSSFTAVEGALTVFVSIIVVFILPNWPVNTSWLTEEEKALADARMRADRVGSMGASAKMSSWKSVLSALSDWRMYLLTLMYMCVSSSLSISQPLLTLRQCQGRCGRGDDYGALRDPILRAVAR
jgi:hypothetical protein